ncbi:MAG: ABC transporter, partial [Acetobacter orientalis]
MNNVVLRLSNVKKTYRSGDEGSLPVLQGVDFTLHAGELVALVAPSGT